MSPQPQIMRGAGGERVAGQTFTSAELAARLNSQAEVLRAGGGGVTFSGGEPLAQAGFVAEVIDQLDKLHVVLDTSGYVDEADFRLVAGKSDLIFFDIKLVDPVQHRRHTGVDNARILHNLRVMEEMAVPFVIRVPLIPGVTDTAENLSGIARLAGGMRGLQHVDLLPFNRAAGAKYAACGLTFQPTFDVSRELSFDTSCFESAGIDVQVL
jgi:pyruvate formate lyase activating enzyme